MTTDDVTQQILDREAAWNRAIETRDRAALDAICSETLRYDHTTGKSQDKRAFMDEALERGTRYDLEDVQILVTGDTASMWGARGESRVLKVWVKTDGTWLLAARQAMRPH